MGSRPEHVTINKTYQPTNNKVKNDFYLCMELMIICTPQKQKFEVSHENVIENPIHFHWKPMHNEQLENLMITFPSSTFTLKLRFSQVYIHLHHLH